MAPGPDLTASSPPARMPKLKYRNPLPADDQSPSLELRRDSAHNHHQPSRAQEPPATPSSEAPSSNYQPSFETASLTSPSLASTASSASSNDSKSTRTKKKTASVFGFLSLKEPSQIALEQYAEAQRKQAIGKGSSSPSSSSSTRPVSSYSAKKLPKTVPKVNSKWDGVPESIKNRHSKSSGSSGSNKNRHSVTSQTSQDSQLTTLSWNESKDSVMTDGTRNPPNSIASAAQSVSNFTISEEPRPISPSPSTTSLPEMTYYFPEPLTSVALPVEPHQPQTYYPSIVDPSSRPSVSSSDIDSQPDHFSNSRPDSPASSTDSADTIVRDTADVIFQKLNDRPQKSLWGDVPSVQPLSEANDVLVPESHDFLFDDQSPLELSKPESPMAAPSPSVPYYAPQRPVQNFSRPMPSNTLSPSPRFTSTPSYRTTPISSGLPTLYEASLASTDAEDNVQDNDNDDDDYDDDDSYSIAPSTVAPSVLSAHWHDSPRERLGLGGRLRMNDVLPWESQRESQDKPKKHRLSIFGKVTPRA